VKTKLKIYTQTKYYIVRNKNKFRMQTIKWGQHGIRKVVRRKKAKAKKNQQRQEQEVAYMKLFPLLRSE